MKNTKKAFTMIELIFVIAILGILAAAAIPKLSEAQNQAKVEKFKAGLDVIKQTITPDEDVCKEAHTAENARLTLEVADLKQSLKNKDIALKTERTLNKMLTANLKILNGSSNSYENSEIKDDFSVSQY